ncbi:MAG: amidohydrolase family protein [Balneolaceae bacterium]|nr:amidohydrolase family protein [Balneolaceae bacterium]
MLKIDSHQHFWNYDPESHAWITDEMGILKQHFLPPDLKVELDRVEIDGSVAVQADQTEHETEYLLQFAEQYDYVTGVVGWLDIRADNFAERLEHYSGHDKLVGLRHIVQDEPDDRFLLRPDFLRGINILTDFALTYDILIFARHLPVAVAFTEHFPDQKFVLDHIAKPEIADQKIDEWENGIRELARHPNIWCKVSGLVTEADWEQWKPDDFKPYLDVVFDAFGVDRLMYGSDWPVCKLAAEYGEVYSLVDDYTSGMSDAERAAFFGGNAVDCYGLQANE